MTKFLNISTDNTLGGSSASDEVVSSQKALKTYIDNHSGGGTPLPDQTGHSGDFLTTDGSNASWAAVPAELPTQTGNNGKFLTTNGSAVSWASLPTVDQAYSSTSSNAQSGTAVASAVSGKQNTITGAATTITSSNLTTSRALISNTSGKVAVSSVTSTELGYVSGVTSAIQTQLNGKVDGNTSITGATKCKITYDSKGLVTAGADLSSSDVTTALGYTPYSSANPAGYTSNVGTVTSVNNVSPVNGNVTLSIPSEVTETTVSNWGFTKNAGTVTSVNNVSPVSGNVTLSIPSEVTETTVSNWGFTKNTGTVTSVNNVSPVNGNVTLSIPTVNDATLTIQQNGTTLDTFTANSSTNKTVNIKTPVFNLFDFKWSDHELNDQSWLKADTFSWQDGTVYSNAYNHLVSDINGKTSTTETIGSYTITYYLATDGHKIVLANQETTATNIYNESGIAWYYVLDTTNQRFKLPRTKYGFTGYRDTVGKYVEAGLPNLSIYTPNSNDKYGSESNKVYNTSGTSGTGNSIITTTQPNKLYVKDDNGIVGNSDTVQPPATQMYLYFYVGEFSQSATEQTAGLNSSLFNGKVDLNLGNVDNGNNQASNNLNSAGIRTVVETYNNGQSWYRVWSDGWIEQGGFSGGDGWRTVSLVKTFTNTNYSVQLTGATTSRDGSSGLAQISSNLTEKTVSSIRISGWGVGVTDGGIYWEARGY